MLIFLLVLVNEKQFWLKLDQSIFKKVGLDIGYFNGKEILHWSCKETNVVNSINLVSWKMEQRRYMFTESHWNSEKELKNAGSMSNLQKC